MDSDRPLGTVSERPRSRNRPAVGRRRRTSLMAYLFLVPALVFFAALFVYPLVDVIIMSFSTMSSFGDVLHFGTLENWAALLTNSETWTALEVTVLWAVVTVAITVLLSLPLALVLNEKFPLRWLVRTLVILPWAIPLNVAAIVWMWIYNGQLGDLNYIAKSLGLIQHYVVWLGSPRVAFAAVVAVQVWTSVPFVALTILAALNGIPSELYEASHIDGAGALRTFQHVTIPLLRPVTGLVILISVIWAVNGFAIIWTLTRGGPADATMIAVINVYLQAFQNYNLGQAAAMATLLVVILSIFAWIYTRLYRLES